MEWQIYIWAFLVGGAFALLGQLVLDYTNWTPGHVLSGFIVAGGVLGGLGIYPKLVEFAGGGASMPIASFGNSLVQGAIMEAERSGVLGVLTGMFELTSPGITAGIVFAFFTALVFDPKG